MLSIDHGYFFNDGSYLVNDFHPRGTILVSPVASSLTVYIQTSVATYCQARATKV